MITRNSPQVDFVISMTICPISLNSVTKNENLDMLAVGVWSVVAPKFYVCGLYGSYELSILITFACGLQ